MDILSVEILEKLVSPKDITTFVVIWFFIKSRVKDHFTSIESSLDSISKNITSLEEAIVSVEKDHAEKINDLNVRVVKLETLD